MKKVFLILLLTVVSLCAQEKDATAILEKVTKKFSLIKDYQADLNIKLDMSFIKMPPTKAKIYYKQPDKFTFDSDGFAMLPKEGFNYNPSKFLGEDITKVFVREDEVDGNKVYVIKVIPNSDSSEIVLSTLYIDQSKYVLCKVETNTKHGAIIKVLFTYDKEMKYPLPKQVKLSFNFGDKKETKEKSNKHDEGFSMGENKMEGDVYLTYSNYKINKGLSDSIFEKNKKKK